MARLKQNLQILKKNKTDMENIAEKLKGSAEEYSEYLPGVLMTGIEMISRFTLPKFHFVSVS